MGNAAPAASGWILVESARPLHRGSKGGWVRWEAAWPISLIAKIDLSECAVKSIIPDGGGTKDHLSVAELGGRWMRIASGMQTVLLLSPLFRRCYRRSSVAVIPLF